MIEYFHAGYLSFFNVSEELKYRITSFAISDEKTETNFNKIIIYI